MLRQSLGFTDPLGIRDLVEPPNVRSYLMSSTQHTPSPLPLATKEPFGACQQQPNPNPHTWTVRALLQDLLIGVTHFFRDRESFASLESHIPQLFAGKRPDDVAGHEPRRARCQKCWRQQVHKAGLQMLARGRSCVDCRKFLDRTLCSGHIFK